jgi:hypothetical protein
VDPQVNAVAEAIKAYLAEHPHAKDTRAGIQGFWLPAHLRDVADGVLEAALNQLIREGRVASVPAGRAGTTTGEAERLYFLIGRG